MNARAFGGLVASFGLALSAAAVAQQPPPDAAARKEAEAALAKAHQLGKSGDFEGACVLFEKSARLTPTAAALLNTGICHEHRGDWVGALAAFEQALAASQGRADQRAAIQPRIDALRPKVPSVEIAPPPTPGTVVEVNARTVEQFGAPLRLNPGEHELRATAPGARPHAQTFSLAAGQTLTLRVPELPPDRAQAPSPLPSKSTTPSLGAANATSSSSDAAPAPAWQNPVVLTGVGLFAVGGAVATWQFISMSQARSRKHDLSDRHGCNIEGDRASAPSCDVGVQDRIRGIYDEEEEPARKRAWIALAAGGVGAAVAVIGYLASPSAGAAGPSAATPSRPHSAKARSLPLHVEPRLELAPGLWSAALSGTW